MKTIITGILIFISIATFSQKKMQWEDNIIHDTLMLSASDTLETTNLVMPNDDFTWVYGVNYGDIDSTTILLYIQASIPTLGWTTISDTITIDSTSTERVYYMTGLKPYYPEMKFIFERDTVEDILDGWIRDILYIRKTE